MVRASTPLHCMLGLLGTFSDVVTPEERAQSDALGRQRAAEVKGAMSFVYQQYKDRAWGADSLSPLFGQPNNDWTGTGACPVLCTHTWPA